MRLAGVAKVKHQLSEYRRSEQDPEEPEWEEPAKKRLGRAWQGDEDVLYDYL